jgi:hypothetical protein
MPDYRVTMTMGGVRAGVAPSTILPTAAAAVAEFTMVEASDITVVAGAARITVRFEADDAELAGQIAAHAVGVTHGAVDVVDFRVTERVGGRWRTVH